MHPGEKASLDRCAHLPHTMLSRRTLQAALPSLLQAGQAASFSAATSLRGLEELIPRLPAEGEQLPTTGGFEYYYLLLL